MLDRIEIFGYRRLLKVSAYVGRKTVAFVGPNEAGKSSVLSALRLFESNDPLPVSEMTRSQRDDSLPADRIVVQLTFTLDEAQIDLARSLPIEEGQLRFLKFKKLANGKRSYEFDPSPVVSKSVELSFRRAWPILRNALERAIAKDSGDPGDEATKEDLASVSAFVQREADSPSDQVWQRVHSAISKYFGGVQKLQERVEVFNTYFDWARPSTNLDSLVFKGINGKMPRFVQFNDDLRQIRAQYTISDQSTDDSLALRNLLRLANLPLSKIRGSLEEPSILRTLKDEANERLEDFFSKKWKQEQITVGIEIDRDEIRVDVRDLDKKSSGWIKITDRSDGLRTFVALASFLDSVGIEDSPILLVDEAEQHLHQNAQGDLIRMLQDLKAVKQVIYTTHSPACLPGDLGNGVRFVEPVKGGHSVIRHDFWSIDRNEHVGFNPLLIIMGAGASAFSSLRLALIAEGVSDMLLLPTLIKLATGKDELEYQVAPGIATASVADMAKLDFVASRVAYVVDGDMGGKTWRGNLVRSGVPKGRIRSLPEGAGLEDFMDRKFYLDSLAELARLDRSSLERARGDLPIKLAVSQLQLRNPLPGSIAFAEFVLGRHESEVSPIVIDSRKKKALIALDSWVLSLGGERTT